ncbi:transposase [Streptomyces sp. NPDC094472]|uniref:transposase n=1 Tax=unclassified Streptomyces TaxID=2593676 RepID=UPI00333118F3
MGVIRSADAAGTGQPRGEDRQAVNGMVYRIRTGISWRDLPEATARRLTGDVLGEFGDVQGAVISVKKSPASEASVRDPAVPEEPDPTHPRRSRRARSQAPCLCRWFVPGREGVQACVTTRLWTPSPASPQ